MVKLHTYPSGLRLIVNSTDFLRSVSVGVFVAAGSSFETAQNNGISHFVEHMLFKGTKKRSPLEIAESIDSIGGQINAYTAKEHTCYYTKATSEYFEYCAEVLSDIVFNSVFKKSEIKKEQKVVLEEIAMQEDSPEDLSHELLSEAFFIDNPLGQTILGPADTVNSFDKTAITEYMNTQYCAPNMVITLVGHVDFDKAVEVIGKYFDKHVSAGCKHVDYAREAAVCSRFIGREKKIEQANLALAFPSYPFNSKQSYAASLFSAVLGGGMSSRLFQRIREQQGLAYSVYSYLSSYKNNGLFTIFMGTNPSNTERAVNSIRAELDEILASGITEQEFLKGKAQLKGSFIMGQESTAAIMGACGKLLLMQDEVYDMDERLRQIDSITIDAVMDAARYILNFDRVCASIVSPAPTDILQYLK